MMRTDLHIHSIYSGDGEFSPAALVDMAVKAGLEGMTLSDHNSTKGCAEAEVSSKKAGIHFVPGIEIDCHHRGTDLHLLGLGIDAQNPVFDALEASIKKRHFDIVPQMISNLARLGITVDLEEILAKSAGEPPSAELFAELLLEKRSSRKNPLLQAYLPGGKRSDMPLINFYLDFFAQGKEAYVPVEYMTFEEALSLIHEAGGIPVVAHPGLNFRDREHIVAELLEQGAMGLEVFNNYHSEKQIRYFAEMAVSGKALMTCGSDFHGKTKPLIQIGHYASTAGFQEELERSMLFIFKEAGRL